LIPRVSHLVPKLVSAVLVPSYAILGVMAWFGICRVLDGGEPGGGFVNSGWLFILPAAVIGVVLGYMFVYSMAKRLVLGMERSNSRVRGFSVVVVVFLLAVLQIIGWKWIYSSV